MVWCWLLQEEDEEAARDDSSSDDEHTWTQEAKKKHRWDIGHISVDWLHKCLIGTLHVFDKNGLPKIKASWNSFLTGVCPGNLLVTKMFLCS